jgi:hypothetical protein
MCFFDHHLRAILDSLQLQFFHLEVSFEQGVYALKLEWGGDRISTIDKLWSIEKSDSRAAL